MGLEELGGHAQAAALGTNHWASAACGGGTYVSGVPVWGVPPRPAWSWGSITEGGGSVSEGAWPRK